MPENATMITPKSLLSRVTAGVTTFQQSSAKFRVLLQIHSSDPFNPRTPTAPTSSETSPKSLFILDSSFNPPSVAHYTLAQSALRSSLAHQTPGRLLLLFATLNADKAPSPASTPHRLALMTLLASDLMQNLAMNASNSSASSSAVSVDIGVTTEPYYTDKSAAIAQEGKEWYPDSPTHVHLVGFDTLTRLFNPKYYPQYSPPLSALSPYFDDAGHRLRVTLRPDEAYGTVDEQHAFLNRLRAGELEVQGGERKWAEQVELVEPNSLTGVSSTKIRNAAKEASWETIDELCTPSVAVWVKEHKIYKR